MSARVLLGGGVFSWLSVLSPRCPVRYGLLVVVVIVVAVTSDVSAVWQTLTGSHTLARLAPSLRTRAPLCGTETCALSLSLPQPDVAASGFEPGKDSYSVYKLKP